MIHLVVLRGNAIVVANSVEGAKRIASGWALLGGGPGNDGTMTTSMLLTIDQPTGAIRDYFSRTPNLQILVARLEGDWAARGMPDIAVWLQNSAIFF